MWFDDLQVIHTEHPVVQADDYYPFGLAFNSYSSGVKNDFLYNGKELQDELDLAWYDYHARQYDPTVGRFLSVDPAADLMRRHSPYNYAFDNPIKYTDPDGMWPNNPLFNAGLSELKAQFDYVADQVSGAVDYVSDAIDNLVTGDNARKIGNTSDVVEIATDPKVTKSASEALSKVNSVTKVLGPAMDGASIVIDAANTDFNDPKQVNEFAQNTASTLVEAVSGPAAPFVNVINEEAKKPDGVTNAKNLAKNYSVMYDAQQQRTQERIQRLQNTFKEGQKNQQKNQETQENCTDDNCN